MRKKCKHIGISLAAIAVFVAVFLLLQALLVPKYMSGVLEGGLVAEYYEETTAHDVIFIGDCEVYENFSPITLWEEYGITSYIRGSAQQLIWQSYYLLEETLQYEKPQVVVFNVLSMKYGEPQSEAYNRMTLDGMRLSATKLKAIAASKMEEETYLSYILPFFRYHSRWSALTNEDFQYALRRDKISHNGYLMRVDVKPLTQLPSPAPLGDYTLSDVCYEYLDKMVDLCEKNGIELILIKSPSLFPHWYDEWDAQIADYAAAHDLVYINFIDHMDACGIDMTQDTYDSGLHLNLSGAEKLSRYFGAYLKDACGLEDHRGDATLSRAWQEKVDFYYETKQNQEQELREYGYLKSMTVTEEGE